MARKSTGTYPDNWKEIAKQVKDAVDWSCVRCGHAHDPKTGYCLTVHHLDLNPSNNAWYNLCPLCQRCHLQIQAKVVMERAWMFEHTAWFKPYAAGYYAARWNYPTERAWVEANVENLILLGQGVAMFAHLNAALPALARAPQGEAANAT